MFPPPELSGPALRRGYFRGKLAEDAALLGLRRFPSGWIAGFSRAVLARVHLAVLQTLRHLPEFPVGGAPRRLGVPADRTFVSSYDPAWPTLYELEARAIRLGLGDRCAEVHHIGSTAVPGLPAKPILDLGVGLRADGFDGEVARVLLGLRKLGYRYLGNRRGLGGHFLEKGPAPIRTHALQLHPAGGPDLARLLRFRDQLRRSAKLTAEYAALKQALAALVGEDRRIYLWYKSHWVNGLLLERSDRRAWGEWLLAQQPPSIFRLHRRGWRPAGPHWP
jgi:GrpB-like predicted nucleotidyltransferase (UPF0157 family)